MKQNEAEAVISGLFLLVCKAIAAAWRWRLEILVALVPYLLALRVVGNPVVALVAVAVLAVAFVLGVPFLEEHRRAAGKPVPRVLQAGAWAAHGLVYRQTVARLRRRWRKAVEKSTDLQPVHIRKIEKTPAGWRLFVRFSKGQTAGHVAKWAGNIASSLSTRRAPVREVRILGSAENMREGVAYITLDDPLNALTGNPIRWPWIDAEKLTMWQPLPLGIDQHGRDVTLELFTEGHGSHTMLLGGLPGGGKTALMNLLTSACALDPNVTLFLIDGKPPALKFWRPRSTEFVGDVKETGADATKHAVAALEQAREWMIAANVRLESEDREEARTGDPIAVVILDELSTFLDAKGRGKVGDILADLVKRGRSAGLAVIVATQKPTGDAIPTAVRSNVDYRCAFKVMDSPSSEATLGTKAVDASTLPKQAGRGYLAAGADITEFGAYFVSSTEARAVAARTGTTTTTQGEANRADGSVSSPAPVLPVDADPVGTSEAPGNTPTGVPAPSEVPTVPHPGQPDQPARRHLQVVPEKSTPRAVMQFRIELELRDHPDDANLAIAKRVGCSDKTVAAARRRLGLERSA